MNTFDKKIMKLIILAVIVLLSNITFTQKDKVIITKRDEMPLKAVMNLSASRTLYVGQEYTLNVSVSGNQPIKLVANNAQIEIDESSKRNTGGLTYFVTPIDTGKVYISIGIMAEKNSVSLLAQNYSAVNYPVPPIHLGGVSSGPIISTLNEVTELKCHYPMEQGIFETYKIVSWKATIGEREFEGNGNQLSQELIQFANEQQEAFLHIEVELAKNKTGHSKSEGVYLIRKNS